MLKINDTNITDIEQDYKYEFDMFEENNALSYLECLSDTEFRILIIYAETKSYRKTAELLNCGASTVSNYINRIKDKLKRYGITRDSFIGD